MKRSVKNIFTLCIILLPVVLSAQVIVGDCKVMYRILAEGENAGKIFETSSKVFYVRGNKTLTESVFGVYKQSVYFNANDSTSVVLKDVKGEKFITYLTKEKWAKKHAPMMNANFTPLKDSKKILGYACVKGKITKANGDQITVYYTKDIKPSVSEYPCMFDKIPGLVLEYETVLENNLKVSYIATSVSLFPVPASLFDIPKGGYRVLD